MKMLVLGINGQLGQALSASIPAGTDFVGLDLPDLDIRDADALLALSQSLRPDVVVNAAAYTAVDNAEAEPELASSVNVDGPRNIATAAQHIGARVIHVSTDFVFDGHAEAPYRPDAQTSPLSVYGRTKRDGEKAVLEAMPENAVIVRTAWLYSRTGNNFVKTMLRQMAEREELKVVADQRGTPTWANSLAKAVWILAGLQQTEGIYHWTDAGECSWHEFALAIQEEALSLGLLDEAIPIQPITTEEYPTAATRPRYSVLDCSATRTALDLQPAFWRANLRRMLKGMFT